MGQGPMNIAGRIVGDAVVTILTRPIYISWDTRTSQDNLQFLQWILQEVQTLQPVFSMQVEKNFPGLLPMWRFIGTPGLVSIRFSTTRPSAASG